MAKQDAYFWRGKGSLKIDRIYTTGEKIPHEKMHKGNFDKMVKDGRIQKTAFDIVDSGLEVDLKKQIKSLSAEIVKLNKANDGDCENCKKLEAELEAATAPTNEVSGE